MRDEDFERVVGMFHDEYRRILPSGGDAQDHEEAIRSAIAAILDTRPYADCGRCLGGGVVVRLPCKCCDENRRDDALALTRKERG